MTKKEIVISSALFFMIVVISTFLLGETAVRILSSRRLIYNLEMVKYAKQLKMADPKGEISHIHRPNSSAALMGVNVSLNSFGYRGRELANPKPAGVQRVLVLGSSVTLGWGVPFDDVFTSVLERELNGRRPFGPKISFEFDNAGVGNYNAVAEYYLFRRQWRSVRPDCVVLQYLISDVEPRSQGRHNFILRHSFFADYLFYTFQVLLAPFDNHKDRHQYYTDLYGDRSRPWKETLLAVDKIKAIAAQNRIPLVVMLVPDPHDLSNDPSYDSLYKYIEESFQKLGVPTLNAFPVFKSKYGDHAAVLWVSADDPHLNRLGHALMAEILYEYILRSNPLGIKKT